MNCHTSLAARLLQDDLSDSERNRFEQHLERCDSCRDRLHQLAAAETEWSLASEFLSDEAFELAPLSGNGIGDQEELDHEGSDARLLELLGPSDDPRMLGRLGPYEVAGVIGSGGMGVVLKAFDTALNRYVAIKVLAPHLATSAAARRRFSREAQAAAAIVHENVIEIHGVDEARGLPYLVMPYIRGVSLQKRLQEEGPLSLIEVLRIATQAAAGLAAAHSQGLVHRDVKPANILLADGVERVTLTDFGLARAADDASLTRTGVIAGTPQYMSPEQAQGDRVDHRSDLFSLGSVMYAMCTGHPPFRAESSYGVLRRISDAEPRPISEASPEMPQWMCGVIHKLLAKSPEDRYDSAATVSELLGQCLAHSQQPGVHELPRQARELATHGAEKPISRPWRLFAIGAAALVAIVLLVLTTSAVGLAVFLWGGSVDTVPLVKESGEFDSAGSFADDHEAMIDRRILGWDDVALEIDQLREDTESLERGTADSWEKVTP